MIYGIRIDEKKYAVGQLLPVSRVWENGKPTEAVLSGTCAVDIYYSHKDTQIESYRLAFPSAYLYAVSGSDCVAGYDDGEVIIYDAHVVDIL